MSPFRLLVLAALGYILYRLLVRDTGQPEQRSTATPDPSLNGGQKADDVLVEDPVCHTYIPRQGADTLTVGQTTHYFCSPECRRKYQKLS